MAEAMGAGAVAPACPADNSRIGMPARMQASIVRQLSVANFIGGTTKQFDIGDEGRARQAASPPATMWIISISLRNADGSEKDVPTCFVVPTGRRRAC
jgi:hypothetical protein